MSTLFVFGDSYAEDSLGSWTRLLSNSLGFNLKNFAIGGSCLEFSYIKLLENIKKFKKDDVVIFVLTSSVRIDLEYTITEQPRISCIINNLEKFSNPNFVKEYLLNNLFAGKLLITGDATGQFRKSAATFTDYEIIRQIFKDMTGDPILKPTRAVKDRVNATNALFKNMLGEIRMFINVKECPRLHKDLQVTQWKQGGVQIDKQLGISDPSDALSYLAYNFEPIQRETKKGLIC